MSVLGDFGRKLIASRQRQAQRQIYAAMLTMDEETVRKAGFSRDELKRKSLGANSFF